MFLVSKMLIKGVAREFARLFITIHLDVFQVNAALTMVDVKLGVMSKHQVMSAVAASLALS